MSFESLKGKVAVITGGTSGIGRAAAVYLSKAGVKVVLGGRRQAEGDEVVALINQSGGEAVFVQMDVTQEADVQKLFATAADTFGGIDIAFNNAGLETAGNIVDAKVEDLRTVLDVNVVGVWLSVKAAIPYMLKRGGGSIINTSSLAGRTGYPGASSYVASKFAVEGLTRSVAREVAEANIRVNTVAPGPIDTAMLDRFSGGDQEMMGQQMPMKRVGTVEDVCAAVAYLASNESAYITGQNIGMDGGYSA